MIKILLYLSIFVFCKIEVNCSDLNVNNLLTKSFDQYYDCLDEKTKISYLNDLKISDNVFIHNFLLKIKFYDSKYIDSMKFKDCDTILLQLIKNEQFKKEIETHYKCISESREIIAVLMCLNKYLQKNVNYSQHLDSIDKFLFCYNDSLNLTYITADTIEGIYIPNNINESLLYLTKALDSTLKNEIINSNIEKLKIDNHLGIGMSIRNTWLLWNENRFSNYFKNEFKISNAEEMSLIILRLLKYKLINNNFNINIYLEHLKTFGKLPE